MANHHQGFAKAKLADRPERGAPSLVGLERGLFGAIFIGLVIVLVPRLGAIPFIALLVAGQMLASVTFDHFGWLGLARRPIGMLLLIGGVVLIRR